MSFRRFMLINYHLNVIRNASLCRRYVSSLVINSFNKTVLENKPKRKCFDSTKLFKCTNNNDLDPISYEKLADETLETLDEYFEDIVEANVTIPDADVNLNNGVLTLNLGEHGTYVINKQTPNKQIWLSSPISGPKRYDYIEGQWIYKHDGIRIEELLSQELTKIFKRKINLN